MSRTFSRMFLILILASIVILAFDIQPANASGTIYIRADGSIEGTDKISTTDNITYTFTDNIYDEIVVERNNIIIDGDEYTLQGTGTGIGIDLSDRVLVIIKNMKIRAFDWGIYLYFSSTNTISGNNITDNGNGIGIYYYSHYNNISGNNIITNNNDGIELYYSNYNNISGNNITNNHNGIELHSPINNHIYHNNFINNTLYQAWVSPGFTSVWDNGYPSGGNYWSDYTGVDFYSGPFQNETGSDGIGDTSYTIDTNNTDRYPLMKPYPWHLHDVGITSVATSKTAVGQGYNVFINVVVFNYGNNTETFNVTAYVDSIIIDTFADIALTSRNYTTVTFTWNTTGFVKSNYTISAYITSVEGEIDTADNNITDGWVFVTIAGDVTSAAGPPDGIVNMRDIGIACGNFMKA